MDETRIVLAPHSQRRENCGNVGVLTSTALHGEPRRLVESDHVLIEIEHASA
jgi:hypothetical protein